MKITMPHIYYIHTMSKVQCQEFQNYCITSFFKQLCEAASFIYQKLTNKELFQVLGVQK